MACGEAVTDPASDPGPGEPPPGGRAGAGGTPAGGGQARSDRRRAPDPIDSVAAGSVTTEGTIESLQTEMTVSAIDSLSRGWNVLVAHPTSFAAFAVVAVLFVVGRAVGPTATAVTGFVGLLGLAAATGILVNGVAAVDAGDGFELGVLFGRTVDRLLAAVVAGATWGLVVTVGLILFLVPGIYLMVRFAFVAHFVFLDDADPIEAFRASWNRTAGNLLPLLAVTIALFLAQLLLSLIPIVGIGIATLTIAPLGVATLTHMYLDLEPESDAETAAA